MATMGLLICQKKKDKHNSQGGTVRCAAENIMAGICVRMQTLSNVHSKVWCLSN